jgi:hypothetical protein
VLLTLNSDLSSAIDNLSVGPPSISAGCAYGFEDGSVAMFGNKFVSGGIYRATLGHWPSKALTGNVQVLDLPGSSSAFSYADAIRLSDRKFVALRDQTDTKSTGFGLTWVSFD